LPVQLDSLLDLSLAQWLVSTDHAMIVKDAEHGAFADLVLRGERSGSES
jgi:hypothetical protein